MASVLITGGTGLIGKHLCKLLSSKGYKVAVLSRKKLDRPNTYFWDVSKNHIDSTAIRQADYIVHLAGAGIADKRWTSSRKKELIDSRVKSAELLFNKVKMLNPRLKGFVTASGTGYYDSTASSKIFIEQDSCGSDFLSSVCQLWELQGQQFRSNGIRTVILRTGVVLSKHGGALEKMAKPIKFGLGAAIGRGDQYIPWIHIDDLCNMYLAAIENKFMEGVYNAVAPEHISNKVLTTAIAQLLKKPLWLPNIPVFVMQILLGEMAVLLTRGNKISSEKIIHEGFQFKFPELKLALAELLH